VLAEALADEEKRIAGGRLALEPSAGSSADPVT
jgi:hypothetical protein